MDGGLFPERLARIEGSHKRVGVHYESHGRQQKMQRVIEDEIRTSANEEEEADVNEGVRQGQDGDERHARTNAECIPRMVRFVPRKSYRKAHLVNRPVLTEKTIKRLTSRFDLSCMSAIDPYHQLRQTTHLEKPVLETCRMVHRMAAMTTSPAAANPLMLMDNTCMAKPSATLGWVSTYKVLP